MRDYHPDPNGMRHAIRCALLALFALQKHGTVDEVEEQVSYSGDYNPNTFKVQVSQVRRDLLEELAIDTGKVQGKLTHEQKAAIEHQLGYKRVQAKIAELAKEAEAVYRKKAA